MYLTIDVGGSKTLLATFSEDGKLKKQHKFPTPDLYPDFIGQLKEAISELCDEKPRSCAIALPGVIDRQNGIALSFGNLAWENVAITLDLSEVLSCPVYLENDAKLAGLAEAYAVRDLYSRVLYITVSTGIGIGLIVDGKIDYSVGDAGGHGIMMEHQGKLVAWEDFASGKAIVRQLGKRASEITDDGDWYIVARNIAIGLINLISTMTPDCIVLGGGVGAHLDKFHERLHDELEIYRNKMIIKMPQILKAQHPEEAVVYGGYLLCRRNAKSN